MHSQVQTHANAPRLCAFGSPAGTTTNQTSVITFKRGAFVPGMPVQPVACRMRWANMDPAWVNDGPTQYVVLLRLMAQVTNYVRGQ